MGLITSSAGVTWEVYHIFISNNPWQFLLLFYLFYDIEQCSSLYTSLPNYITIIKKWLKRQKVIKATKSDVFVSGGGGYSDLSNAVIPVWICLSECCSSLTLDKDICGRFLSYPFDTHSCPFLFGSYTYDYKYLTFYIDNTFLTRSDMWEYALYKYPLNFFLAAIWKW